MYEKSFNILARLKKQDIRQWLYYHLSIGTTCIYIEGDWKTHPNKNLLRKLFLHKILVHIQSIDDFIEQARTRDLNIYLYLETNQFLKMNPKLSSVLPWLEDYFYDDYVAALAHSKNITFFRVDCFSNLEDICAKKQQIGFIIDESKEILGEVIDESKHIFSVGMVDSEYLKYYTHHIDKQSEDLANLAWKQFIRRCRKFLKSFSQLKLRKKFS